MGVSDETYLISSPEKKKSIKDAKLPSSSSSSCSIITTTTTMQDRDRNKGQSRNLELIEVNLSKNSNVVDNNDDDDDKNVVVVDENDDGFKTPSAIENKIKVNYSCPPPAPVKPAAKTMKRRRCSDQKPKMMRCLQVSREDIDSLFPPRSVVLGKDNDSDNKVKKANLSTLMSLR